MPIDLVGLINGLALIFVQITSGIEVTSRIHLRMVSWYRLYVVLWTNLVQK